MRCRSTDLRTTESPSMAQQIVCRRQGKLISPALHLYFLLDEEAQLAGEKAKLCELERLIGDRIGSDTSATPR
jgi:hypothetical protein